MADKEDVRTLKFTDEMVAAMRVDGFSFLTNSEVSQILQNQRSKDEAGHDADTNHVFDKTMEYLNKILEDRVSIEESGTVLYELHQRLEAQEIDLNNPDATGKTVGSLHKFEAAAIINLGDALDEGEGGGVRTLLELIPSLARFSELALSEHVINIVRDVFSPLDEDDYDDDMDT
mmetsp:Transcript_43642/g.136946  ORF Transcript_43642/g.136946 Transcript_43642/m.136946 type:complete len:175 (-) Transcript_43642:120-644(-)|eukprot:CAMPEP_0118849930 /NCGR_PEP_ID=MMETSP1163-20130328/28_1 /TAXON_ID=124430 /ORGANISM="Phaeomonas parva, Strain CCMP2877" /LENGTH=174 /DNA_ID=CAMNT_0006782123 /DNA_START=231 /DNA_END=755 /DNA_ORIENTATION=-